MEELSVLEMILVGILGFASLYVTLKWGVWDTGKDLIKYFRDTAKGEKQQQLYTVERDQYGTPINDGGWRGWRRWTIVVLIMSIFGGM